MKKKNCSLFVDLTLISRIYGEMGFQYLCFFHICLRWKVWKPLDNSITLTRHVKYAEVHILKLSFANLVKTEKHFQICSS